MNLIEKFEWWWKWSKLREWKWNIYNGVRNLYVYFPMIWKTRDWDFTYIYEMLSFKIKKHRELLEKYGNEVAKSRNRKIHDMKVCELLINRLVEDDYIYCKSDWSGLGMKVHYYHPLAPSKDKFKQVIDLEAKRRLQDKELLFKIITKHGDSWWD